MEKVEKIYSVRMIKEVFHVEDAKAIRMMKDELKGFKIGKEWRVLAKEVDKYIDQKVKEAKDARLD
jgi:hypothetical protein